MSSRKPVMIVAGGTGGHIYPGLAVAEILIRNRIPVIWLGTENGMESDIVNNAGIAFVGIKAKGLRGKALKEKLKAGFHAVWAGLQAFHIMIKHKPSMVLGMGGYVAGPAGVAARCQLRPLVIHEQNAMPGMTNQWLSKIANMVLEGFPNTFDPVIEAITVGNPVRESIAAVERPESRFEGRVGQPFQLFVFGGSLGASIFNEILPQALALLPQDQRPRVLHQCGHAHVEAAKEAYKSVGETVVVKPYVDDMSSMYEWADLVICRAGALTVSELACAGSASILVPFPHAVDDHQTANAKALVEQQGAILIDQDDLTPERLARTLLFFIQDRQKVKAMAVAAKSIARPAAAQRVAEVCASFGMYGKAEVAS